MQSLCAWDMHALKQPYATAASQHDLTITCLLAHHDRRHLPEQVAATASGSKCASAELAAAVASCVYWEFPVSTCQA